MKQLLLVAALAISGVATAQSTSKQNICDTAAKSNGGVMGEDIIILKYPNTEGIEVTSMKDGKNFNYLQFTVKFKDAKEEAGMKGLTVYLDNGKKIEFTDKVRSYGTGGRSESGIQVQALLELNSEKAVLLKANKIVKVKVATHEREIKEGAKIQEYVKCVLN